ncbi:BatD family protein [Luteimonas aquatica]|uniref:BatD family protein n=1 Tax=Luteimonas aquatica TaxID=450364 RepID=UPI001F55EAF1|nr:BatD family protein [Luteimonas aquatica]
MRCLLCLSLLCMAVAAQAQTRAWIDRDNIAVGETTTLNIETDDMTADAPDYSALERDFDISGSTSSRQVDVDNGRTRARVLYAVALQPKREGTLTVPALRVGARNTQPLSLTVVAARATRAGGPVFIEASADDPAPYVQQSVGYTVRLYYETPLISGQLDQPAPDGATLQRVGKDLQYTDQVQGKRYTVVERRYLLIPERSGPLSVPGAQFRGRGVGGFFDDMFGDGERDLSASGASTRLQVRAVPANAPQPWLPLRGLTLRYLSTPQRLRNGEAATVVVEARADGASAAQLPELQISAADGAQVFPDPVQSDDRLDRGRPQATLTRKFSLVPARTGALRVAGPRIVWWDTRAGIERIASLPDLNLQVAAGAPGTQAPANTASPLSVLTGGGDDGTQVAGGASQVRPWAFATVLFAMLWLLTLGWALHRRGAFVPTRARAKARPGAAAARPAVPSSAAPRAGMRDLKHALDTGDLGSVAEVLCAMAQPVAADLDALRMRLDDPAQRQAVAQLQHARWGGGEAAAARAAVRAAFAAGPRWKAAAATAPSVLPPLYPS